MHNLKNYAWSIIAVLACLLTHVDLVEARDCVVLLHGLGRTKMSMWKASLYLEKLGYTTVNLNYPSTHKTIADLADEHVTEGVKRCMDIGTERIHFLTHSLGGILVRQYLQSNKLPNGSRLVMLSPPNKGSEVADSLKDVLLYRLITGSAGQELGTSDDSVPNRLRAISLEVGVITGNKNLEPWFLSVIDGPNDGKVSIERAKLREATDFLVVEKSHTFIMMSNEVLAQVATFFRDGKFNGVSKTTPLK